MTDARADLLIARLIAILRPSGSTFNLVDLYTDLARRLSIVARKSPPWQWRYIQGIQARTLRPSPRIDQAARHLLDLLTDAPDPVLPSETVRVHAPAGSVTPGAWILSKSRPCANPACTVHFVPRVPWQVNCPLHTRRHPRS